MINVDKMDDNPLYDFRNMLIYLFLFCSFLFFFLFINGFSLKKEEKESN